MLDIDHVKYFFFKEHDDRQMLELSFGADPLVFNNEDAVELHDVLVKQFYGKN